jgi:hypothetical protein
MSLFCFWACNQKDQLSTAQRNVKEFFTYSGNDSTTERAIHQLYKLYADSPFSIGTGDRALWDKPVSMAVISQSGNYELYFPVVGGGNLLSGYLAVSVDGKGAVTAPQAASYSEDFSKSKDQAKIKEVSQIMISLGQQGYQLPEALNTYRKNQEKKVEKLVKKAAGAKAAGARDAATCSAVLRVVYYYLSNSYPWQCGTESEADWKNSLNVYVVNNLPNALNSTYGPGFSVSFNTGGEGIVIYGPSDVVAGIAGSNGQNIQPILNNLIASFPTSCVVTKRISSTQSNGTNCTLPGNGGGGSGGGSGGSDGNGNNGEVPPACLTKTQAEAQSDLAFLTANSSTSTYILPSTGYSTVYNPDGSITRKEAPKWQFYTATFPLGFKVAYSAFFEAEKTDKSGIWRYQSFEYKSTTKTSGNLPPCVNAEMVVNSAIPNIAEDKQSVMVSMSYSYSVSIGCAIGWEVKTFTPDEPLQNTFKAALTY